MEYLFKSGDELKGFVSGIDASFDIENIHSSILQATDEVIDVVGKDVYQLALEHYQSDNYNVDDQNNANYLRLDKLVKGLQAAQAPLALFYHFPWLEIRVSNSSVTTVKSQNETAAYKYQTDKAKETLLQLTYSAFNQVIEFLNTEATAWKLWEEETNYKAGEVILWAATFYTANIDFTTGTEFDATNLTVKPTAEVIFSEWTLCEQKTDTDALIFDGYKDFGKYYGIDRNATFYIKARFIIQREIGLFVPSRFPDGVPSKHLKTVKFYLAYKVMAEALHDLDINLLPSSLRGPVYNEMNKKGGDVAYIKDKLHSKIMNQAEYFMKSLDMAITADKATTETSEPMKKYDTTPSSQQKYFNSL